MGRKRKIDRIVVDILEDDSITWDQLEEISNRLYDCCIEEADYPPRYTMPELITMLQTLKRRKRK